MRHIIIRPIGAKLTRDTEIIGQMVASTIFRILTAYASLAARSM